MTQDFGREEDERADGLKDSSSQDLPDFLRTEPIPVVAPPEESPDSKPVEAESSPEAELAAEEPAADTPVAAESPAEDPTAAPSEAAAAPAAAALSGEPVAEEPAAEEPVAETPAAVEAAPESENNFTEVIEQVDVSGADAAIAAAATAQTADSNSANEHTAGESSVAGSAAAGSLDAGIPDAESPVAGSLDAGIPDAESPVAGSLDAETSSESVPEAAPAVAPISEATFPVKTIKKKASKGKKATLITLSTIAVLAAAYAGTAWYFADRVPTDTTVAGVDISGLSKDAAIEHLTAELDGVIHSDIAVTLGTSEGSIEPVAAGLTVDLTGTVDRLVGFSLEPQKVFGHLFGMGAQEAIIHSNGAELRQAIEAIEENLNVAPVEGELALIDGEVQTVEPEDGLSIDVDEAMHHIVDEWLQGARPVELPGTVVTPTMDADRLAETRATIIDPLFSGSLQLTINGKTVDIEQETIVEVATLGLDGTKYELMLDPEPLVAEVNKLLPGLGESPTDARFIFENGRPVIVPSVDGTGINPETLATEVARAAVKTGEERAVSLDLETTEPDFTTKDAEALGIVERISHFKTPVPYDPVRTKNLVNGAKMLTSVLIKPGETFSLIEALGPIDAAHGYVSSGVVVNGFADTAMGGGLSQMSTTAFNAAFEAGMEDVAHTPHSRFFVRYPEGREATIFAPDLDMKWRNNTPYGVLVQSWIDDQAHVALWSTKHWDTKITTGPRTNFTAPQTVYNTSSGCTPESGGQSGFTVTVQRIVSKDGVRNDEYSRSYSHTYQPWNHVVCGEKPKPAPAPSEQSQADDDD